MRSLIESYPNLQPNSAEIEISEDLPWVLGDEAALTQAFSNLLGNAVKFVASGTRPKVRVWGELRTSQNQSSNSQNATREQTQLARIWVEDNGIGIPLEFKARIFDMFQRGTKDFEGTGIGLAIVRKVIQQMGGSVGVESQPGKGSKFWIELNSADRIEIPANK
jgi:signal transduction histidine kinase